MEVDEPCPSFIFIIIIDVHRLQFLVEPGITNAPILGQRPGAYWSSEYYGNQITYIYIYIYYHFYKHTIIQCIRTFYYAPM